VTGEKSETVVWFHQTEVDSEVALEAVLGRWRDSRSLSWSEMEPRLTVRPSEETSDGLRTRNEAFYRPSSVCAN